MYYQEYILLSLFNIYQWNDSELILTVLHYIKYLNKKATELDPSQESLCKK